MGLQKSGTQLSNNSIVLQESCAQPEVTVLCRKLMSSAWVGALVPAEELRDMLLPISQEGTKTLLHNCLLPVPPLFLYSLHFLISHCLNLPRRLNEVSFLQIRNGGRKGLVPTGHLVLLGFTLTLYRYVTFRITACVKM